MDLTPQVLFGKVMHRRVAPKVNGFSYGIYNLVVPVDGIDAMPMPVDRFGLLAFHRRDHGDRDGGDLKVWLKRQLATHGITADGDALLVTLPRVLGYVFNPVSFWFCRNRDGDLAAVLCEVNNTFGETHLYLCARLDGAPIAETDVLTGRKLFHVSPFMPRDGFYRFRFKLTGETLGVWIDHLGDDGAMRLHTALTGQLTPMTPATLRRAFWRYPLVTFKAITLIHWQAAKLLTKGIRYVPKPHQFAVRNSSTTEI